MAKKILNKIATIITILAVLFTIIAVFTIFTTERGKAPEVFGFSMFRVVSGSMEPEIKTGSLIFVKSCEPSEVETGDVITFYSRDVSIEGQINTHRVINVSVEDGNYQFETKGDANLNTDSFAVYGEDLIGKVVGQSYLLGKLTFAVGSKLGMFLIIVVPLALIFIINIKEVVKTYKITLKEEEAALKKEIEKSSTESDDNSEEE